MKTRSIGKLTRVDLQECSAQAETFSQWLAQDDGLGMLGEAIGEELIRNDDAVLHPAGHSHAMVAEIPRTGSKVVIYSQWEQTNDEALGRLITLTAALQPALVVWVASRFSSEHHHTFDWLGRTRQNQIGWIGLEFELWRIDDSAPAPKFTVVTCRKRENGPPLATNVRRASEEPSGPIRAASDVRRERGDSSSARRASGEDPVPASDNSSPVSVQENFVYTKTYS